MWSWSTNVPDGQTDRQTDNMRSQDRTWWLTRRRLAQGCAVCFSLYCCPIKRSHFPKPRFFWGEGVRIGVFKPNVRKIQTFIFSKYFIYCNQSLHSDKDRQLPFAGGPIMPQNKSKMADGRHLQKSKNRYISATDWQILMKCDTVMHLAVRTLCKANKIWEFLKSKTARAAVLKNKKIVISQTRKCDIAKMTARCADKSK